MSTAQDAPPPVYNRVGRHGVMPETTHDETARFNFLANLNRHLSTKILPGNKKAWEARVKPKLVKTLGREPQNRHEVRKAMLEDPIFQTWSALRRNTMEMRQQAGRTIVLRQLDDLIAKAKALNDGKSTLHLDPGMALPRYVSAVDHHCMPGSYHTELVPDDVGAAANYDVGIFVTTGGALGRFSDGGGAAVAEWMKKTYPDFNPEKIVDIGCGLGHNVISIAQAYPDATVYAIDVGAPMLRYGHARAQSMGVTNIHFIQANAETLDFEDNSVDWVQTTMFLHETSNVAMRKLMATFHRILKPGGLMLHVEQPQYHAGMDLFEQAMRDWDAFYNNEPFWTKLHEIDLDKVMTDAGFVKDDFMSAGLAAVVDEAIFPKTDTSKTEDYGRAPAWHVFGSFKR